MGEDIDGLNDMEGALVAADAIKALIRDVRIPSLQELGVEKNKLEELAPTMADAAIASGSPGNNPRQPTKEEIIELYSITYEQG